MSWVPYVGPEGGEGWQDAESGDVVYQEDAPGESAGEELQDAESDEILDAVAEVFDSESAEELEGMDLNADEIRLAVQELAEADELQEVSETVAGEGGQDGADPHAADGSEDDEPVREALEDAVGGEYDGEEAEVGDTVYEVDHDKGRGWYAREATVTEVKEGASGISVDMDYAEGGRKTWQTARLLYGPADDGDGGDDAAEEPDGGQDGDAGALSEMSADDDPREIADALGIDHTDRNEFRELRAGQQEELRDGLAEVFGEEPVDELYGRVKEWKQSSSGEAGAWLEAGFDGALGLDGESFRDAEGAEPPSDEQAAAMHVMSEVSSDFAREEYGDELEMHRGISSHAWEEYKASDDEDIRMSSMAVGTTGKGIADSFAFGEGSATVSWTVDADDVVFAMDALTEAEHGGGREAEFQVRGGTVTPDEVDEA